jgi:diguanylate cyclase (GGDEF)-like protein/PAS domain S-box-containing protein
MFRVYSCIVHEHDYRLVIVAGIMCLLAAFTAFSTFERARAAGPHRNAWLGLTAFVSGTGIWATHFVAMLAFQPHLPIGYEVGSTLLSVAAAILITGVGWRLALREEPWTPWLGGAVVGTGIGTMHFIGMSAVELAGRLVWDQTYVLVSMLIGIVLGALAMGVHMQRRTHAPWRSALLFTLAICGMHFTAMAAASVYPDPMMEVPAEAIDNGTLTVAVVAMAFIILSISFVTVLFDRRMSTRAAEESQRLRAFADAAIEGLVVIDGERVIDANRSFLRLANYRSADRLPQRLQDLFHGFEPIRLPADGDAKATECQLVRPDGSECEVEVLLRSLNWQGADRRVLAVRDISERKESAARIAHLAYHDTLTGLPNRTVFADHVAQTVDRAAVSGDPISVLCIGLDGFKAFNDLYGHAAGDELLFAVGNRLRAVVQGNELVARLGGDEFAIDQLGGAQPAHAGLLAERIVSAFESRFAIGEQAVRIGASVGIAVFPTDAKDAAGLLKNADMALWRAKAEGRSLVRFYEAAMDEALRQRRQLEADLRIAFAKRELNLHYQPLADLDSGRIFGFEALLRWNHPQLGPISPEVFIRLAEESGLIIELGEWVLQEACAEAARWTPALKLAVNLSPVQFLHDDLVGSIERVLAETKLEPARLDLEVTEGLLIKDAAGALATLQRLKALGVEIAMDDFGTGYSSLSYFRMFPFDKVKIDRSFVHDIANPQALAIIRSVIGLGHGLKVPVLAEGVETVEQLEILRAEGCDQVQGYLISRPNPISHFEGVVMDRAEAAPKPARSARRRA